MSFEKFNPTISKARPSRDYYFFKSTHPDDPTRTFDVKMRPGPASWHGEFLHHRDPNRISFVVKPPQEIGIPAYATTTRSWDNYEHTFHEYPDVLRTDTRVSLLEIGVGLSESAVRFHDNPNVDYYANDSADYPLLANTVGVLSQGHTYPFKGMHKAPMQAIRRVQACIEALEVLSENGQFHNCDLMESIDALQGKTFDRILEVHGPLFVNMTRWELQENRPSIDPRDEYRDAEIPYAAHMTHRLIEHYCRLDMGCIRAYMQGIHSLLAENGIFAIGLERKFENTPGSAVLTKDEIGEMIR